jgi:hypothetical protein
VSDQQKPVYLDDQGNPISQKPATASAQPSGLQQLAKTFIDYVPNPVGIWRGLKKAVDPKNLPTGGAIAGGMTGAKLGAPLGPWGAAAGGVIGAGVGGFVGKGGEQAASGEDISLPSMATEGAKQAAIQAGGGVIGKGLQVAAKPVYNLGLRATMKLRRAHPDLAKTGINEGIAVSKRGTEKAARLRGESRQTADAMIAKAEQAGAAPIRTGEVVTGGGFANVAQGARTRAQAGMADETGAVADRARQLHLRNRSGVPLTQAQAMKREAQEKADSVYRAAERGGAPPTINADLDAATARGFRQAIERSVPGVADVNARTRSLVGLTRALEDAGDRNHVLSGLLFPAASGVTSGMTTGDVGTGLTTAAGTAALTSPGTLSRLAIGMDRTGRGGIPANVIRAALLALMNDEQK